MRSGKGFTLAEIMIVMAFTVVIAAAAIPSIGGSLQAVEAHERGTRLYMAMEDARLVALKQSRTATSNDPIAVPLSEETIQDLKDGTKSAALRISCEEQAVTLDKGSVSETVRSVKYTFQKNASGILIFHSIIIGDDEIFQETFTP